MNHRLHLLADPSPLLEDATLELRVESGRAQPYGVTQCGPLVNFSVPCRRARRMTLRLFAAESGTELLRLELDSLRHRSGDVWHVALGNLRKPVRYSWFIAGQVEAAGPGQPEDPERGVLDPWAVAIVEDPARPGEWHGLFPLPEYTWRNPSPPLRPMDETVIYETHLRGFTADPSSGVTRPGSYAGLVEKIPYLKELGVTAVELLPVMEFDHRDNPRRNPETGEALVNFWGYDPLAFFAPKASYASVGAPLGATVEFRRMVDELHGAGIEVFMDVVFNHTAERDDTRHQYHFRLLDNPVWYMVDRQGVYRDFSGCGNSLNCNHPLVRRYIMDCLRFWVSEMGVDGFRFDLASILGRDSEGRVLDNPPVLEAIAHDPLLSRTKIIAEAWDAAGLYQVGRFPSWGRWAEWNGPFRDTMRRLLRGEAGQVAAAATRLAGSSDLYGSSGRSPLHSINFITAHDGFTLADLVRYEHKHNLPNGEENRDGSNSDYSSNYGEEGPGRDPGREALRMRQQRNALALLFLSQGVPMLLAGDEFGRSQQGNNNAWCQDNRISWLDWTLCDTNADLLEYTRSLIRLRRLHPGLRREGFFRQGPDSDIRWHGVTPEQPDFGPNSHTLAFELRGNGGQGLASADLYIALNFWSAELDFELPRPPGGGAWRELLCTASGEAVIVDPAKAPVVRGTRCRRPSNSILVLASLPEEKPPKENP